MSTPLVSSPHLPRAAKPHAQDKRQPHRRDEQVQPADGPVVGRPQPRLQPPLPLQRKVHAAQPADVAQQQRELQHPPDGQVLRHPRHQGAHDGHGERQPARLVEQEDRGRVVRRLRRHRGHGLLGRQEVQVGAVKGDERVGVGEEARVQRWHRRDCRCHRGRMRRVGWAGGRARGVAAIVWLALSECQPLRRWSRVLRCLFSFFVLGRGQELNTRVTTLTTMGYNSSNRRFTETGAFTKGEVRRDKQP